MSELFQIAADSRPSDIIIACRYLNCLNWISEHGATLEAAEIVKAIDRATEDKDRSAIIPLVEALERVLTIKAVVIS